MKCTMSKALCLAVLSVAGIGVTNSYADNVRKLKGPHHVELTPEQQALLDEGSAYLEKGYKLLMEQNQPGLANEQFEKALAIETKLGILKMESEAGGIVAGTFTQEAEKGTESSGGMERLAEVPSMTNVEKKEFEHDLYVRKLVAGAKEQAKKAADEQKDITQQLATSGGGGGQQDPNQQQKPNAEAPKPNAQQPQANGEKPQANGQQPQANGPQPQANGQQPQANGPQPQANGEKPQANGQQPQANGQQPQANGQQPQANGQPPQANGQQPQANGEKPQANGQQPQANGQQPQANGQQPQANGQQPQANGQQPQQPNAQASAGGAPNPNQKPDPNALAAKQEGVAKTLNDIANQMAQQANGRTGETAAANAFRMAAAAATQTADQIRKGDANAAKANSLNTERLIDAAMGKAGEAGTESMQTAVGALQQKIEDLKDRQDANLTQLNEIKKAQAGGGGGKKGTPDPKATALAERQAGLKAEVEAVEGKLSELTQTPTNDAPGTRSAEGAAKENLNQAGAALKDSKVKQSAINATIDLRAGGP